MRSRHCLREADPKDGGACAFPQQRGIAMEKKICPYCDQPISGMYCKGCRRFVKKPVTVNVTYYLNERHSESEESCQYHGDLLTGKMEEVNKKNSRQPPQRKRPKAVTEKNHRKQSDKGSKIMRRLFIAILIYIGVCLVVPLAGLVLYLAKGAKQAIPEYLAPGEHTAAVEADDWERSDEEVKAAGVACNGSGHFNVTESEFSFAFQACLAENGFHEWALEQSSYNQAFGSFSWYETRSEYILSEGDAYLGTISVESDTATGELHGVTMYTEDEETFYRMADAVLMAFEVSGLADGLPDGRAFYEEACESSEQKTQGQRLQYGMEVSCYIREPEDPEFYHMSILAPVQDNEI